MNVETVRYAAAAVQMHHAHASGVGLVCADVISGTGVGCRGLPQPAFCEGITFPHLSLERDAEFFAEDQFAGQELRCFSGLGDQARNVPDDRPYNQIFFCHGAIFLQINAL